MNIYMDFVFINTLKTMNKIC